MKKFMEENDKSFNLDNWNHEKVLYITGLSGSGKSYLSRKIQKNYKCEIIQLDDFRENGSMSSVDVVSLFKSSCPETTRYFDTKWSDYRMFEKYFPIFFEFLINFIKQDGRMFIVEGIQIYHIPFNKKWFYNKPLIVKGTDVNTSYDRQVARGSKNLNNTKVLKNSELLIMKFVENYKKINFIKTDIINFMSKL